MLGFAIISLAFCIACIACGVVDLIRNNESNLLPYTIWLVTAILLITRC